MKEKNEILEGELIKKPNEDNRKFDIKSYVVIEQLPIITENLRKIADEIINKTANLNKVVCNEQTVKDIKKMRTELGNEFKEFETARKKIKNAITNPYKEFENSYKDYVSETYKSADLILKTKIDEVEDNLKLEKENELREYFDEKIISEKLDFMKFEDLSINITLSASKKSLLNEIDTKLESISSDMIAIKNMEHSEEIEAEYRKHRNLGQAINDVKNRHFVMDSIKESNQKYEEQEKEELVLIEKVEEVLSAPEVEECTETCIEQVDTSELLKLAFEIIATKEDLDILKSLLKNGNYECRQLKIVDGGMYE